MTLKILFIILACSLTVNAHAQGSAALLQDSTGLHAYKVERGDTILVAYDTAYVLNKRIYALYKATYQRMQAKDPSSAKLMAEYESLINLQDSMLKAKESYYQNLSTSFNSLTTTSNSFADKTDLNVRAINSSLLNVGGDINNIKTLLNDSLSKLKKQNGQKLKMAAGGFTVGIAVTALIFLVNK